MKNLMYIGLTLLLFAFTSDTQKDLEKKILGTWCNPYTYQSTGELKGFEFKKGGKCKAVNVPSLDLKSWEIKDGYLITKGFSIEEDGTREVYETKERIAKLNADTLYVITQEENPRVGFIYLNTKIIKERVTPEVAPKK